MSYFPHTIAQRVIPYLIYADAARAIDYSRDVFGSKEELRIYRALDSEGHRWTFATPMPTSQEREIEAFWTDQLSAFEAHAEQHAAPPNERARPDRAAV